MVFLDEYSRAIGGAHGDHPFLRNGPGPGNLEVEKNWPGDVRACRIVKYRMSDQPDSVSVFCGEDQVHITKLLGSVGELVAISELMKKGLKVGAFGILEMNRDELNLLPEKLYVLDDYPLGSSALKVRALGDLTKQWSSDERKKPFDLPPEDISKVTSICRSLVPCEMARNGTPPCVRHQWLESSEPWNELYHINRTYKPQSEPAYQYVEEYYGHYRQFMCFERLNIVLSLRACDSIEIKTPFLRDNLRIHVYVKNIAYKYHYSDLDMGLGLTKNEWEEYSTLQSQYYKTMRERGLLHLYKTTNDYKDYDEQYASPRLIQLVKKWKDTNDEKEKLYPYPGKSEDIDLRYDLVCTKNEASVAAIEVKTNRSKLSYGQLLRLNLLRHFGHIVRVARVKIDKKDLNSLESVMMPKKYEFRFEDVPELDLAQHLVDFDDMVNKIFVSHHGEPTGYLPRGHLTIDELEKLTKPKG